VPGKPPYLCFFLPSWQIYSILKGVKIQENFWFAYPLSFCLCRDDPCPIIGSTEAQLTRHDRRWTTYEIRTYRS
jgi:hypothetical protein